MFLFLILFIFFFIILLIFFYTQNRLNENFSDQNKNSLFICNSVKYHYEIIESVIVKYKQIIGNIKCEYIYIYKSFQIHHFKII